MAKKKASNDANVKVTELSLSDLYALYRFVSSDRDKVFGIAHKTAEKVVSAKLKEIENELYCRAYGHNPYETKVGAEQQNVTKITVDGQKPEDVVSSFPLTAVGQGVFGTTYKQTGEPYIVSLNPVPADIVVNNDNGVGVTATAQQEVVAQQTYIVADKNIKNEGENQPRFVVAKKV